MKRFYRQDEFEAVELFFENNVNVKGIPKELKENGKWCCYKARQTRDRRFTKTPYSPIVGMPANPRDKNTFSSFSEAYEDYCWELNGYDGIGILLTDGISLIDIDDSYMDGKLSPAAKKIINYFDSYAEVSASGNGIHVLIKVNEDFKINTNRYYLKNSQNKVEVYLSDTGRYSTVTGNRIEGSTDEIKDVTEKLEGFLNMFMLKRNEIKQEPKEINKDILSEVKKISDSNLLGKIRDSKVGEKFIALYDVGMWEDRYNSQSEADMGLAGILAFFCAGDFERIEKFMWESGLAREKWEKNKNYLSNTIKKAISNCYHFYNPKYRKL